MRSPEMIHLCESLLLSFYYNSHSLLFYFHFFTFQKKSEKKKLESNCKIQHSVGTIFSQTTPTVIFGIIFEKQKKGRRDGKNGKSGGREGRKGKVQQTSS